MPTGRVKWFSTEKGFGFIEPDDGGPDQFVHATALEGSGVDFLQPEDEVSFEIAIHERSGRERAIHVRLLD
jgi:CspA family cold shock protein